MTHWTCLSDNNVGKKPIHLKFMTHSIKYRTFGAYIEFRFGSACRKNEMKIVQANVRLINRVDFVTFVSHDRSRDDARTAVE